MKREVNDLNDTYGSREERQNLRELPEDFKQENEE